MGMYLEAIRALERNDGAEALHVAAYELCAEERSGSAGNIIPAGGQLQYRPTYLRGWEGNSYSDAEHLSHIFRRLPVSHKPGGTLERDVDHSGRNIEHKAALRQFGGALLIARL